MTSKIFSVAALCAGLVVAGCSGDAPEPACARLAAYQPGTWLAVDVSGCDEPGDRLAVWAGGESGLDPLGAEVVPEAADGAGCVIVWGGPSVLALGEGPWCLTLLRDGLPEDAVCVPEDLPGVDPAGELLLVHPEGEGWSAALPGPAASCAPILGGQEG